MPAEPWSVPPEAFSAPRRPNSDQTWMSTRSAMPRASRSRWKASSESEASCRSRCSVVACVACVSKWPDRQRRRRCTGRPGASIAASPASRCGNGSVELG